MKTIRIISLHLAYGGVEKAIISMANLFVEKYNVEILSVYNMPGSPAFPLDERVKLRYLLKDTPNREQWKDAVRRKDIIAFIRESFKSVRVLIGKRLAVIRAVRSIKDGILITTRHEDNIILSAFGSKNVLKIAQLHHDHNFLPKYVNSFEKKYRNIDVFALLAPKLRDEVSKMMKSNTHTRLVSIPNFLADIPAQVDTGLKEKTVLAVGRLDPVKGFDALARLFVRIHALMPDWKLRIIGEGSERALLEKIIAENDAAEYICLTGKMDAAEVEEEMRKASLYAMTSKSEGIPFVILEAQSCYLPCVAYDVRVGPGLLIEDGSSGWLVPDGDETAFISKMVELMQSDELRARMGENARRHALRYSREEIAGQWYSVLEDEND